MRKGVREANHAIDSADARGSVDAPPIEEGRTRDWGEERKSGVESPSTAECSGEYAPTLSDCDRPSSSSSTETNKGIEYLVLQTKQGGRQPGENANHIGRLGVEEGVKVHLRRVPSVLRLAAMETSTVSSSASCAHSA